uniref:ARAD1A02750p n=1 Tax=Blastobotrys adeninivorans TaxID=409370 RepID=A0A060T1U1_BLAAD
MNDDELLVPISGKHILKIALRVKKLIDTVIPIEFDPDVVSKPDSLVLNERVYQLLLKAAGGQGDGSVGTSSRKYRATLVFVLLTVKRWYMKCSKNFLYDSTLYDLRGLAAEYLAKRLIERQEDEYYLFKYMLCQRYTITLYGRDVKPANALELAVDLHATVVIASSGFERCMKWIWRGWILQNDPNDPETGCCDYVVYQGLNDTRFSAHFDPDRIKTPKYQNYLQLAFSIVFLAIYTLSINQLARDGLSVAEVWLYVFTIGYVLDEVIKLWDVGYAYLRFWNVFNDCLYVLILSSAATRVAALAHAQGSQARQDYNLTAYHLLATAAPFIWGRILLYLDSVRFFGAMLVVLKELMKESMIFFVLLIIVAAGFLQAFIGLDEADGALDVTRLVVGVMTRTILDSPEFDTIDAIAPAPYGTILYYAFTFLISTLLLNILIALFNSAYEKVYDNANDEFMALVSQKTLQFVRAPDTYVFVPPLNLLEFVFLTVGLQWWMSPQAYKRVNYYFMMAIYSPILVIIAWDEARVARRVTYNRSKGATDDANETDEEWDLHDGWFDGQSAEASNRQSEQMERAIREGDPEFPIDEVAWEKNVQDAAPAVDLEGETGPIGWEHHELVKRVDQLTQLVLELKQELAKASPNP